MGEVQGVVLELEGEVVLQSGDGSPRRAHAWHAALGSCLLCIKSVSQLPHWVVSIFYLLTFALAVSLQSLSLYMAPTHQSQP